MQGKVQHNNKKKVATAETEREGTKRKKNKRKQVCGGPTSNPASALGFRNRGVISVKTHSQPAYCLNEATFAPPPHHHQKTFFSSHSSSPQQSHTQNGERPGSYLLPSFKNRTTWLSEHCSALPTPKMTSLLKKSHYKRSVRCSKIISV